MRWILGSLVPASPRKRFQIRWQSNCITKVCLGLRGFPQPKSVHCAVLQQLAWGELIARCTFWVTPHRHCRISKYPTHASSGLVHVKSSARHGVDVKVDFVIEWMSVIRHLLNTTETKRVINEFSVRSVEKHYPNVDIVPWRQVNKFNLINSLVSGTFHILSGNKQWPQAIFSLIYTSAGPRT